MDWQVGIGEESLYNYSISLDALATNPLQVPKKANRRFTLTAPFPIITSQYPTSNPQTSPSNHNVFLSSHPNWCAPPTFSRPLSQHLKTNMPLLIDRSLSIASTSSNGSWLVLTSERDNNFSKSRSPSSAQLELAYLAKQSKVFRPISNVDAERNLFLRRARDN